MPRESACDDITVVEIARLLASIGERAVERHTRINHDDVARRIGRDDAPLDSPRFADDGVDVLAAGADHVDALACAWMVPIHRLPTGVLTPAAQTRCIWYEVLG